MTLPSLRSPCCFEITLQQGVQLISAIGIAACVLVLIEITLALITVDLGSTGGGLAFWIIMLVVIALAIGLNVLQLLGAKEKSVKKIKICLIINAVLIPVSLLTFIFTQDLFFGVIFNTILTYLPVLYQAWVLFCFYKEIQNEPSRTNYDDQLG